MLASRRYIRVCVTFIFLVALFSCNKKDKADCYICTTTYLVTTDQPVPNYPATTSVDHELCDISADEIKQFELTNKGSESSVVSGVTYSSSYSTVCREEK